MPPLRPRHMDATDGRYPCYWTSTLVHGGRPSAAITTALGGPPVGEGVGAELGTS